MLNSHTRMDAIPETMDKTEVKIVLDMIKFMKDKLNYVAKIKLETRLKQQNDRLFSKKCKREKIILSVNHNCDFY